MDAARRKTLGPDSCGRQRAAGSRADLPGANPDDEQAAQQLYPVSESTRSIEGTVQSGGAVNLQGANVTVGGIVTRGANGASPGASGWSATASARGSRRGRSTR